MNRAGLVLPTLVLLALVMPAAWAGPLVLGGGGAFDADAEEYGVEGRAEFLILPLLDAAGYANFFPGDANLVTLNGDVHWKLFGIGNTMIYPLGGVRLAMVDGDSDVGLNLGGGARLGLGDLIGFGEFKYVTGDLDEVVFQAGVLFGN